MAEFFATLGFNINKGDIKKVDKQLDALEARARKMSEDSLSNIRVNISRFGFSDDFNTRLHKALRARMKVASGKGIAPEITISKFDVDRNALLRETRDAVKYVENNLRMRIRPDVGRPQMDSQGVSRYGGGVSRFGAGMGVGAAAGSLGRGFIPGLGLAFGVSQMNRLNQQLIGQDLAATAVFGSQEAGQEQLDWIRNLGNKLGFDYRSQANAYMKMGAAGKTAGMSTGDVQDIFTSMAEYGRVMGLNDEDMKGSMRAVEQMLNKGQVYAEELKMQLGEKFPAAIQLMAEAVAGGDTEKLFDMMEKGEVSSIEALPKFAKILSRQARVGGALTEAMKTSLAEQMRFNNAFNDMVMAFSEAGFEKGQAGIFKVMRTFIGEMTPMLEAFGEAWIYVADVLRVPLGLFRDLGVGIEALSNTIGVSKGAILSLGTVVGLLAFPFTRTITLIFGAMAILEDFTAFLTGRDSLIGSILDNFKSENPEEYTKTIDAIKEAFDSVYEVVKLIGEGWKLIWDLLSDTATFEGTLGMLRTLANEIKAAADAILLISGKKDPNEMNTHVGENDGMVSYVTKGTARMFKNPVQTMTERQADIFSGRQDIATFLYRLADVERKEGRMASMSPTERKNFEMERENVRIKERLIENTYNIEVSGADDPVKVAQEIERIIRERQQDQLKGPSEKAAEASD
jgi:tape measure domain-containing protein